MHSGPVFYHKVVPLVIVLVFIILTQDGVELERVTELPRLVLNSLYSRMALNSAFFCPSFLSN